MSPPYPSSWNIGATATSSPLLSATTILSLAFRGATFRHHDSIHAGEQYGRFDATARASQSVLHRSTASMSSRTSARMSKGFQSLGRRPARTGRIGSPSAFSLQGRASAVADRQGSTGARSPLRYTRGRIREDLHDCATLPSHGSEVADVPRVAREPVHLGSNVDVDPQDVLGEIRMVRCPPMSIRREALGWERCRQN